MDVMKSLEILWEINTPHVINKISPGQLHVEPPEKMHVGALELVLLDGTRLRRPCEWVRPSATNMALFMSFQVILVIE